MDGFVAEGAGENVFVVKGGVVYEPELTSALQGITRDTVHALAEDLGLRVLARRLTRDDVYLADEAFFCGTAAEITPIRELDRRTIGDGRRGPVTAALQRAYFAAARGADARYERWLTPV